MTAKKRVRDYLSGVSSDLPDKELREKFLKAILENTVNISDEIYQKDFRKFTLKINWNVCGAKGYQIFEHKNYTQKYGEHLEDGDITLTIQNIDNLKLLIEEEDPKCEFGRDANKNIQICLKEPFLDVEFKNPEMNPLIISKIPIIFDSQKQRVYGISEFRQPDFNKVEIEEIEALFKEMLIKSDRTSEEIYQKAFRNKILKINWAVKDLSAYQIFEETKYHYEFGKQLDDADISLTLTNLVYAKLLLQGKAIDIGSTKDAEGKLHIGAKIPIVTSQFKDPKMHWSVLTKTPFFRSFFKEIKRDKEVDGEEYGSYIPINLSAGEFKNEVVPLKVFEHFINKASNIVMTKCYCREHHNCQNHEVQYGCMYMGDDTKKMVIAPFMKVATKEEALERVKSAIDNGLIPLLGRAMGETEGQGVKDTSHFLSCCFCCSCCCVNAKMITNATEGYEYMYQRIKGLEIVVDESLCVGCGTCLEVCMFKGREVLEGKAHIDPDYCLGCGRCVDVCPNGAISINIEDPSQIDELIEKIESVVDVTSQPQ